jgi:ABC-2 type transport system permease protein
VRTSSSSLPVRWLLWPRWRQARNAPRSRDGRSKARLLLFALLGLGFMAFGFLGARWLFARFLEVEFLAELLIRRTIGIVLLFFSGLLVFSNVITAFSTCYLADDLPLLVSSPVPVARLYLARLFETWAQSSWMMLVFALPIVVGCGPVLNAPWWFYVAAPVVLLPLTVLCAAVGTMVTMLLARLLPARRTQDVLIVLAVVGFLVLYLAFRLAEPERFLEPDAFGDLVSLVASLKAGSGRASPPEWAVQSLFGLLRDEVPLLPAVALFSAAPAACTLGAWLARGVYLRSYSIAQEGRQEAGLASRLLRRLRGRARVTWPSSPVAAVVMRDTRVFFRTTSQWTQLLLIGALIIVYVFNFKHFRTLQATGFIGPLGLFFLNVALGGFVVTTIAVRFLYPAVSLEGRAVWAVQAAPVTPRELLRAKVRWGFWPLLLVSEVLAVASGVVLDLPAVHVASAAAVALVTTWALAGMAVGLGASDPRFHVDNPAKIASSIGGVVFMFLGLLYLAGVSALLAMPLWAFSAWVDDRWTPELRHVLRYGASALAALALSVVAHVVPMWMGVRHLSRREG